MKIHDYGKYTKLIMTNHKEVWLQGYIRPSLCKEIAKSEGSYMHSCLQFNHGCITNCFKGKLARLADKFEEYSWYS